MGIDGTHPVTAEDADGFPGGFAFPPGEDEQLLDHHLEELLAAFGRRPFLAGGAEGDATATGGFPV